MKMLDLGDSQKNALVEYAKSVGVDLADPDVFARAVWVSNLEDSVRTLKAISMVVSEIRMFEDRLDKAGILDKESGFFDIDCTRAILTFLGVPEDDWKDATDWLIDSVYNEDSTVDGASIAIQKMMRDIMSSGLVKAKS